MKKLTFLLVILLYVPSIIAQWVPVNNGLDDFPPTALWPNEGILYLGTHGGGVYITDDHGDNWTDFNGNLGNLFVKDVRINIGLIVATEGGPYATYDGTNYFDCTGTGLTNTDINFFWAGNEGITGEFMVGTNGGGLFAGDHTSPWIMNWTAASTGLSGDALIVNDGAGVTGGWALIATNDGMYRALEGETVWTAVNTGLSGDALYVQRIFGFTETLMMIATYDGLYTSIDLGNNWVSTIPDEKFNTVFFHQSDIYPNGIAIFAFGENGFYTFDFVTWSQMDFEGIEGEVTAATADASYLYLGFTMFKNESKESGGIYRKPIDQLITGIKKHTAYNDAILHQNSPNPFGKTTQISYFLANSGYVSLKVFDMFGREVTSLVNDFKAQGQYQVEFDASGLSEGLYFYILDAGKNSRITRKMVITN